MQESFPVEKSGTNILPIPPALEFPFPRSSAESASAPTVPSEVLPSPTRKSSQTTQDAPSASARLPAASNPRKVTRAPRPHPKERFLSERPVPAQRRSVLGMRRGQTSFAPTALTDAARPRSSSSSDSEDDEPLKLASTISQLSGQSPGISRHSESIPEVGAKSRESDDHYRRFSVGNDNYKTRGRVSKRDGRLNISVHETNNHGYLAHALGTTLQHHLKKVQEGSSEEDREDEMISPLRDEDVPRRPDITARLSALSEHPLLAESAPMPPLNIVIMVIGSRGDIQPFLKVGKLLKEKHGHRVRIATHPAFKKFVEQDIGLEFFSVGGDPAELMAFMVKNPGLMPSVSTLRAGEVGRKRDSMFEMFQGFWRACINATDDEHNASNLRMMGDNYPFVADAIIANPPSFAHIHCAERLGIPLHLMFTFPYSPTQQFPHPLANIRQSNLDTNYTNFMSYPLVEMMTWQGLGDLVNRFRVHTLGLEPVSTLWAPGQLFRLKVPYTYMWSPGLIPKPKDWGPEIDISGFVFLDLASSFKPPEPLTAFLEAGEPPVYIGFGSIVVDDPEAFTRLIFEAVKKAGVRALISKGWGGLGDEGNTPDNIFMLENTPHDWLFPQVSAVVHHGGAGTTAIGLKCGKPTMIVPFFGDQPFWGVMVSQAGAGASEAIPYKRLTPDALAEGIMQCLTPEARAAAEKLAHDITEEGDGAKNAVESFHRHLPMRGNRSMRCSILPNHVAVWKLKHCNLKLSALAGELLVEKKLVKWQDLRLIRHCEWNDFEGPGEPLTGGGAAIVNSASEVAKGVGSIPFKWAQRIKKKGQRSRREKQRRGSKVARNSSDGDEMPNKKGSVEKQPSNMGNGDLSQGGQHGVEGHLPAPQTMPGTAHDDLEKQHNLPNGANGSLLRPGSSSQEHEYESDAVSITSEQSHENIAQELAEDTGASFAQTGEALAKVPMDLSLAVMQGFHNAPRLYGDSTVRTPPRISGMHSGLRAAGQEFTFGVYDGVTGLFVQPYKGAREKGALGFVQGVGKGLGGFVLKDLAAIIGPFAYTMKGVHKELIKGKQPTAFIRKARMRQGGEDVRALDGMTKERELTKIETAWRIVCEIQKEDETRKQEGVKGRVAVLRDRKMIEKKGGYESLEQAKRALENKQAVRREREQMAQARRWSGEERRSSKMSKRGSILKLGRRDVDGLTTKEEESSIREKSAVNGSVGK